MMFLVYLYSSIAVLLAIYAIVERKRLLFYKEINQMKQEKGHVAKVHVPIRKFSDFSRTAIIPSIESNQSVLFEYRRLTYVAIPLGENDILVSRV